MIGEIVTVIIDRPLGSRHPRHEDIVYPVNYGYVPGIMAPDGEEQDAYVLGVSETVKEFTGRVIAIIHRFDDVEEKWVVAPENISFTKEEIMEQVFFQEQYFQTEIRTCRLVRAKAEDAPWAQKLQQEAFAELLEKYQDYDISPGAESLEKIRWKISHPGNYYYFIQVGENTVGGIRVVDIGDGSRKKISPIYIMAQYRVRGYAQGAIREAERIHGVNHWKLDTILQETGNCYLYEKMGYHQTGHQTIIKENMTIVDYEKD